MRKQIPSIPAESEEWFVEGYGPGEDGRARGDGAESGDGRAAARPFDAFALLAEPPANGRGEPPPPKDALVEEEVPGWELVEA